MNSIFDDLFILDLANNHQGNVDHAKRIITRLGACFPTGILPGSIKLQYRDLDTFLHKDHLQDDYAKRFLSTRLDWDQFHDICEHVRKHDFSLSITPFDEKSVDMACQHDAEILKVASCSADDFPLLEAVAAACKPIVASTGGLTIPEIDSLVSFLDHKGAVFALHHCVSVYPMLESQAMLGMITEMKQRYPGLTIGWSTHESPTNLNVIKVAYALGARMFERHVGLPTENSNLNAYSSTPEQIAAWVASFIETRLMIDTSKLRPDTSTLRPLKRGVYARRNQKVGEKPDTYLAMPLTPGQYSAGEQSKIMEVMDEIKQDAPVRLNQARFKTSDAERMAHAVHHVKALVNKARIALPPNFEVEYSHHYGVKQFTETGTTMIEVINRHYAKKLLIMLPEQRHPKHYHKIKDETFNVLYGDLTVLLDGKRYDLKPGDLLNVQPGVWHSFSSVNGCVFEEISTTSINGDSVYADSRITNNPDRKTKVKNWGRFLLKEKLNG